MLLGTEFLFPRFSLSGFRSKTEIRREKTRKERHPCERPGELGGQHRERGQQELERCSRELPIERTSLLNGWMPRSKYISRVFFSWLDEAHEILMDTEYKNNNNKNRNIIITTTTKGSTHPPRASLLFRNQNCLGIRNKRQRSTHGADCDAALRGTKRTLDSRISSLSLSLSLSLLRHSPPTTGK